MREKLNQIAVVVVLAFAAVMIVRGLFFATKPHSVKVGGQCAQGSDCESFLECASGAGGKKTCMKTCNVPFPNIDPCPSNFTCKKVNWTQTVNGNSTSYSRDVCIPN